MSAIEVEHVHQRAEPGVAGSTSHRIDIEPTSLGNRGQRYRATYAGSVLIETSLNPEFDACRALLAMGITGSMEVWRPGATFPTMTLDIERGAGLTVSETDANGLRIVRWQPFSDAAPNAVLSRCIEPRTAVSGPVATLPSPINAPAGGRLVESIQCEQI